MYVSIVALPNMPLQCYQPYMCLRDLNCVLPKDILSPQYLRTLPYLETGSSQIQLIMEDNGPNPVTCVLVRRPHEDKPHRGECL